MRSITSSQMTLQGQIAAAIKGDMAAKERRMVDRMADQVSGVEQRINHEAKRVTQVVDQVSTTQQRIAQLEEELAEAKDGWRWPPHRNKPGAGSLTHQRLHTWRPS